MAKAPEGYVHETEDGRKYIKRDGEWVQLSRPVPEISPQVSYQIETNPLAPAVEFSSGVARGAADAADFFTTSPINTIGGLMGSDFKVPTFRQGLEAVGAGRKGYMEPGIARDIVGTAGEWAPAYATMRPTPSAATKIGPKKTQALIDELAPSIDDLKSRSADIYRYIDDMGATIPNSSVTTMRARIGSPKGFNPRMHPKTAIALDELDQLVGTNEPISPWKLDNVRRIASEAARDIDNIGKPTADAKFGRGVVEQIDDLVFQMADDASRGPNTELAQLWKEARGLVQRRKKAYQIQNAIDKADNSPQEFQVALRRELLNLVKRIGGEGERSKDILKRGGAVSGSSGWTAEEIKAIRKAARGGNLEILYRQLGKLGLSEGRGAIPIMGGGLGYMIGESIAGPGGGIAGAASVMAAGKAFSLRAEALISRNVRAAEAMVRAGKNGRRIVQAYMKTVPKTQQNPQELAGLLLRQQVPIPTIEMISRSPAPLAANAGFLASQIANLSTESGAADLLQTAQ
jgi:hypothetical protein